MFHQFVEHVEIRAMDHARNLRIIFYNGMTMEKQVNKECLSQYTKPIKIAEGLRQRYYFNKKLLSIAWSPLA